MSETKIDAITLEINASSKKASDGIEKLAKALAQLVTSSEGIDNVTKRLNELEKVVASLTGGEAAKELKGIAKGIDAIGKSAEESSKKVSKFSGFKNGLMQFASGVFGVGFSIASVGKSFGGAVNEANDYIETLNYASQVMGSSYPKAKEYAEQIENLMGIDSKQFLEAQTTFMTMAQGFGLASNKAYQLSKGLTELGYDISSIKNDKPEEVFQRLQSAVAGEIEPVRRWGVALDQASMKEWLMKKGLDSNVSSMNQASKALIRYNMLVETMNKNGVIGDMARTLSSPANALRILKQQFTQLARAIGEVFIPIIVQVIPYVQAFVSVLTSAIKRIATFFGFEMPDWSNQDWSTPALDLGDAVDDVNDGLDKTNKKVKEFKKQLMGFDELNIINVPDTSSSNTTGGTTPTVDISSSLDAPEVWTKEMLDGIQTKVDALKKPMKVVLGLATAIGITFLGWKLTRGFESLFGAKGTLLGGLSAIAKSPLLKGGLVAKLFPKSSVAAAGTLIASIALIGVGLVDLWKNCTYFRKGIETIGTGISFLWKHVKKFFKNIGKKFKIGSLDDLSKKINDITGGWFSLGDAAIIVGALLLGGPVGIAIAGITLAIKGIGWAFEEVTDDTGKTVPRWKKFMGDTKKSISEGWNTAVDNFKGAIGDVKTAISTGWDSAGKKVSTFMTDLKGYFSEKWDDAKKKVSDGIDGIKQNITKYFEGNESLDKTVKDRMKAIRDSFGEKWDDVKTAVSTGVGNVISGAKEKLEGAKETIGTAWNTATTYIQDKKAKLEAYVATKWDDIKKGWHDIVDNIKDKVAGMKAAIATKWDDIKKDWESITNKVKDKVADMKARIATKLKTFKDDWADRADLVKDKTAEMKAKITTKVSDLKKAWNDLVGKLKDKTLSIGLKFSAAAQDLKDWVNTHVIDKVNDKFKDVPILKNHLIPHLYAKGGFPEEGPFFMNRGEIAGKFSNGKGVVANNMQIIEGISRGVQNGIMAGYRYANMNAPTVKYDASSLAEQMTTNGQNRDQNITVTLNVDGQEMARKVFKVHNSTVKQTGRSPLMI